MKMNTSRYQTRDLPTAAFLVTVGYPLLAAQTAGGNLVFEFPSEAAQAATRYFQGATVPAREFYGSIRDLKALIHNRRETRQ